MKTNNHEIFWDVARRLRLRSMLLADSDQRKPQVHDVAEALCGVQAQDFRAASLGVRVRSKGLTAGDFSDALFKERSVVRTWLMRETIHVVPAADLGWMLSLFGPRNAAASVKRAPGLGIGGDIGEKGIRVIQRMLNKTGTCTRIEISTALGKAGIPNDPLNRVQMHLIRRAGSLGIICEVAPKDGKQAFGLLDGWVKPGEIPGREEALELLARRYLRAFQPASEQDLSAWSGLSVTDSRTGLGRIGDEILQVNIEGRPAWMFENDLPRHGQLTGPCCSGYCPPLTPLSSAIRTETSRYPLMS
ncbi:MAG: winged helix DNA-binding domain-containing protein [Actinomycetota bacterium]